MAKVGREEDEPEQSVKPKKPDKTTHVRMKKDLYQMLQESAKAEGLEPGLLLDKLARPQITARWLRNKPLIDQQKRLAREDAGLEEEPKTKRRRARGQG